MPQVYVPWSPPVAKQFAWWERPIASAAIAIYHAAGPIVRRFPAAVCITSLIACCLITWLTAMLLLHAAAIREFAYANGAATGGEWLSMSAIADAARASNIQSPFPTAALWLMQSLFLRDFVALQGVIVFTSVLVAFSIWWERKVSAYIQSRLGPMRVGGWHGWAQSIADGIKLLGKEDLIPTNADRYLFRLAPYLCFVPALGAYIALPFGLYWVFRDLDVALLMILAMLGLQVLGVLLAGWASNNKWSVYGAMREACQVVSYEIPLTMSLLVPVMVAGTLRLNEIAAQQSGGWFHWYAWHSPWTFLAMFVFFIASLAQCKRAPFDLPEAESELVAGFHTEYSGFRWSLFFFAEYASMFVVSGLLVILFLGAWDAPWALASAHPGDPLYSLANSRSLSAQLIYGVLFSGPLWFIAKCMFLIYVQMWLRWTLPRLRIDQVLYTCIQVFVPLMFVVVLLNAGWEFISTTASENAGSVAARVWFAINSLIAATLGIVGLGALLGMLFIALGGKRNRMQLVGTLGVRHPRTGS